MRISLRRVWKCRTTTNLKPFFGFEDGAKKLL
jgi:hypothetical protein